MILHRIPFYLSALFGEINFNWININKKQNEEPKKKIIITHQQWINSEKKKWTQKMTFFPICSQNQNKMKQKITLKKNSENYQLFCIDGNFTLFDLK